MTNKAIVSLILEVYEDEKKEKLSLIDNIIRARRSLVGMGIEEHAEAVLEPGATFDKLYEMSLNELEMLDFTTSAELNRTMKKRMKELGL